MTSLFRSLGWQPLTASLLVCLTGSSVAAARPWGPTGKPQGPALARLLQTLDLSQDQRDQVATLQKSGAEQAKQILQEAAEAMGSLRKDQRAALEKILTPEQQQELASLEREMARRQLLQDAPRRPAAGPHHRAGRAMRFHMPPQARAHGHARHGNPGNRHYAQQGRQPHGHGQQFARQGRGFQGPGFAGNRRPNPQMAQRQQIKQRLQAVQARLQKALKSLDLTEDQQKQVAELRENTRQQVQASLAKHEGGNRGQAVRQVIQAQHASLQKILTPEQQEKLQKEFPRFGKPAEKLKE